MVEMAGESAPASQAERVAHHMVLYRSDPHIIQIGICSSRWSHCIPQGFYDFLCLFP